MKNKDLLNLKQQITDDILKSYTRQGFGRLLKSEIDLIMFDFSVKMFFSDKNKNYFMDDEFNYFSLNKQDTYELSKKLKTTEKKVMNLIEQIGLLKSLLDDDKLALNSFIDTFKKQKQDKEYIEKGKLQCYVPNRLLKSYIESKINTFGNVTDYSFNKDILIFDISVLLQLFNLSPKNLEKWITGQKEIFNESEVKKIKEDLLKKDFSIKTIGIETSKILLSKFVGKSSDIIVDSIADLMRREN